MINTQQLSYQSIETLSKPNVDPQTSKIEVGYLQLTNCLNLNTRSLAQSFSIQINSDLNKIVTINTNLTKGIANYNQSTCSISIINPDDYLNQVNQLIWLKGNFKYKGQFPSVSNLINLRKLLQDNQLIVCIYTNIGIKWRSGYLGIN